MVCIGSGLMNIILKSLPLIGCRDAAHLPLRLFHSVYREGAVHHRPVALLVNVIHGHAIDVRLIQIALAAVHLVQATSPPIPPPVTRSEEHTSELQSLRHL